MYMDTRIRKHFVLMGDVQGVGLRYRADYAAKQYGVSGWVRNLEDGTVELEAEGTAMEIDAFLLEIEKGRYVCITDMRVREIPVRGTYGFEIR